MIAIALWVIAVLILASVLYLKKFMQDMAIVEGELINELREIKDILAKIHEKQL